jgi:hypothetical protein
MIRVDEEELKGVIELKLLRSTLTEDNSITIEKKTELQ